MKRFKQRDYINISVLIIVFLLILFSIVRFSYVNGSTADWSSQHWIIPEYFRNLFYKTGDLFPSFAFNLGAGQNIYNLSYYGLLSPVITLSYLFKSLSMINYIMIIMIIVVISSVILMYYWLHRRFESKYAFIGTLLFLLASPLIYHTHRDIMVINYMPFLIMALIGVDLFFEKNKKTLLTISIFLIIMTSYYFSISAIVCILIYGLYKFIEYEKEKTFKHFLKKSLKFLFPIFVGILMSAVLIFPTLYSLISTKNIGNDLEIVNLLIPTFSYKEFLYSPYTLGLTSIIFLAIAYSITAKNKENKILSIIFLILIVLPISLYVLNLFSGITGLMLIPLLPLSIILITNMFEDISIRKNIKFIILTVIIFGILIGFAIYNKDYYYLIEPVLILITFILYKINGNKNMLIYVAVFTALVFCLISNYSDKLVTKDDVSLQYNTYNYDKLSNILDKDENLYRLGNDILGVETINRVENIDYYLPSIYSTTQNEYYKDFYINEAGNEIQYNSYDMLASSKNVLFNTLTGVKYLITNSMIPIGYKNVKESNIYINENVLPVGYSTSNIMSKEEYDSLSYPDNIYALLTNIIVDKNVESNFKSNIKEEELKYEFGDKGADIIKDKNRYIVNSNKNGQVTVNLKNTYSNKLLLISFDVKYKGVCEDVSIKLNGINNIYNCNNNFNTFKYVISSNSDINNLFLEFTSGEYEIYNIKTYTLDYQKVLDAVNSVDALKIDKSNTSGDDIKGTINVTQNGYFILTIPYDKGFGIYLDGKRVEYEKVNESFIGFEINEGKHEIEITYISPYLFEGLVTSLIGYMIFLPIIYSDFRKKKED